jgi:hypothetical protein
MCEGKPSWQELESLDCSTRIKSCAGWGIKLLTSTMVFESSWLPLALIQVRGSIITEEVPFAKGCFKEKRAIDEVADRVEMPSEKSCCR